MDGLDLFGSPLPQVHILQTKSEPLTADGLEWEPYTSDDHEFVKRASGEAFRTPPASPLEIAFRHRCWIGDRSKVRSAMVRAALPAGRVERFDACGGDCIIEVSEDGSKHRVKANHCGDRFCVPCMAARGREVCERLTKRIQGQAATHLILTLKNSDRPLPEILDHLYRSFSKLRETVLWKKSVRAGAASVEIKLGRNSGQWHVHLHCLLLASYIDARSLSQAWLRSTGDSKIVKLVRVRETEKAVFYVAKYATKGWSNEVVNLPDRLCECLVGLRGRRLLITFGGWGKRDVEPARDENVRWRRVGRISFVAAAAVAGEAWAVGCLRGIGVEISGQPGQLEVKSIAWDDGSFRQSARCRSS